MPANRAFETLMKRSAIRDGFFEADHGFARLGVAEFFAREPLHSFGIVMKCVDRSFQFSGGLFLLLNLCVKTENLRAHVFVLPNLREIPNDHQADPGEKKEENDRAGQFAPNPEIDFHYASKLAKDSEGKDINWLSRPMLRR
jgi:hypothetical protein